jgi:hypothetical protein
MTNINVTHTIYQNKTVGISECVTFAIYRMVIIFIMCVNLKYKKKDLILKANFERLNTYKLCRESKFYNVIV